ncbi:PREDICTED: piggyBac transposable element-derived protein 4-like [Diuraphis noxia]|uniref:piggyBac transposable element-derived protein 4-like n=1 Tax=Diuraphis noxia TaxID=143948 RepID=UPI0007636E31|nr:PREDICTED: piggyBac transposable element-derived protein 4-like [Diuraphis noxia]
MHNGLLSGPDSFLHVPKVRDYWSIELGFSQIYKCMSRTRFEAIRSCLHFNDNSKLLPVTDINHDRLHKLRPLVDYLNNKFKSVPYRQDLSLDEQLCATKAHSYLKQYLPAKPHKWGFKLYVLCDYKGYAYNCEIYTGQENQPRFRLPSEPDLGSSSNIVVRLSRDVPQYNNYKIYFDNFYTSVPVMDYLYSRGILSLGTVRTNRLPNCKLNDSKMQKKLLRGKSIEYISSYKNTPISALTWKDNKPVTLLSTYAGKLPETKVKRFNRSTKIVNSWLLYKRVREEQNLPVQFELADWRKKIAYSLTKSGDFKNQRGRRSISIETKRASTRALAMHPTRAVRTDGVGHSQIRANKRGRCKFPKCNGYTWIQCNKCDILLCNSKTKTCFNRYHDE